MYDHELESKPATTHRRSLKASIEKEHAPAAQSNLSHPHDPLSRVAVRFGDASQASAHASALDRAAAIGPLAQHSLLQLQRQYGNRYVQRVLNAARNADGEGQISPELEANIQRTRSGGQALDRGVRAQMERAFNVDFGRVRVHTGGQADALNRALHARAFTTGEDIFFREGHYRPGSSSGQELLAHELTHVVQQTGGKVQRKLSLGRPDDRYEQEADRNAKVIIQHKERATQINAPAVTLQRLEEEPIQTNAENGWVQRQDEEEKEEETV